MSSGDSNIKRDRVISIFPQAYRSDASPYVQLNFDARVLDASRSSSSAPARSTKIVVIGDVGVGKTCLVHRFCSNEFQPDYKATIGVDFEVEFFSVLSCPFKLQIWDTAGQERFQCIASSYYRGAKAIIVVFDMNDVGSLMNVRNWKDKAIESAEQNPHLFIVGNKKDLLSDETFREIERDAVKMAKDLKAEYWSTSAKTGDNVADFFQRVAALTFDAEVRREKDALQTRSVGSGAQVRQSIRLNSNMYESKPKKKCCGNS